MPMDSSDKSALSSGELRWQEKVKQLQEEKRLREEEKQKSGDEKPVWLSKIEKIKSESQNDSTADTSALDLDINALRLEQERQEKIRLGNRVNVSKDFMSAEIILVPKEDGAKYTEEDIRDILMVAGVKQGLLMEAIRNVCQEEIYFMPVTVAVGKPVKNGLDGYFTYHFNTSLDKRPKVNPDGSVDYYSIQMYITAEKGQLLATYTPSTAGEFGFNVQGQLLVPQKGKSLPRHKGHGIYSNEEQTEYRASFSGKVELLDGSIEVSRLIRISGDLDMTVGNITFDGDVSIGGEVATGMKIQVSGNVEISGHVGAATIIAGGDVVLKSGMQGEQLGVVTAGKDVSGRFFEGVTITAGGNIKANYLFMCRSEAEGSILIAGSKGAIVGGESIALNNIEAQYLGNNAYVTTHVKIGFTEKYIDKYNKLNKKIEKIRSEMVVFDNAMKNYTSDEPRKMAIDEEMYGKITQAYDIKKSELDGLLAERHSLLELLASVKNNSIKVKAKTFEGVLVQIDTTTLRITEQMGYGEFVREGDKIKLSK